MMVTIRFLVEQVASTLQGIEEEEGEGGGGGRHSWLRRATQRRAHDDDTAYGMGMVAAGQVVSNKHITLIFNKCQDVGKEPSICE